MNNDGIYYQTYLNLEKELLKISEYIYITDIDVNMEGKELGITRKQLEVYSPYIADLIIRCGVEIEALSKLLFFRNCGMNLESESGLYFDTDCLNYLNDKWNLDNKEVVIIAPSFHFKSEENYILTPLYKSSIRQKPKWKKAYQALKHNRYKFLKQATVETLIHSMAALYLLNVYNKNVDMITNYNDIRDRDYSFGSKIFSVRPPQINQSWNDNEPIFSESPFIVTLLDSTYSKIEDMRNSEFNEMVSFLDSQPESSDPNFIKILKNKENLSGGEIFITNYFIELGIYRFKREMDEYTCFADKKKALLESLEWKSWINQHNDHLKPQDITDENIDSEIDSVGRRLGLQLFEKLLNKDWINILDNDNVYEVKIPR